VKRLLKEPLLHFLLLGALLFGVNAWLNRGARHPRTAGQVRISESDLKWLHESWARQWQREPSRAELRALATDFLREELMAREARAMGLDENDTFIRRWLAQKLEFLIKDTSGLVEPTEEDLRKFYAAHPERFQLPARISFAQVFFSREKRQDPAADAKGALAELAPVERQAAPGGDPNLFAAELREVDPQAVAGQFGEGFANSLFKLRPGGWVGPIESTYGFHLVRVSELKPGRQLEFAEVKARVLECWREQRQQEDNANYFAGLLKKYDVVLDEGVKPLLDSLKGGAVLTR
jgi:hypothetical protein